MNNNESEAGDVYVSPYTSHDCVDFFFDGGGDNTIRPLTGKHRERAKAEWEKILAWRAAHPGQDYPEEIDIIVDGPGDNTVRPITGERRKQAEAEWAKIQYWRAVERGEINPDETPPPPPYAPPPP